MSDISRLRVLGVGNLNLLVVGGQIAVDVDGIKLDVVRLKPFDRGDRVSARNVITTVCDQHDSFEFTLTKDRGGKIECRSNIGAACVNLCFSDTLDLPSGGGEDHVVSAEAHDTQL